MADNWFTRHNPGVLFDKDTWRGVGQWGREVGKSIGDTARSVKKNYWDDAAGNKNFWRALGGGEGRTYSDNARVSADMGNSALNTTIGAAANAIPNAYNMGAGLVNMGLGLGSKALTLDVTTKGPRLPYAGNWYNGYDFFKGGTPGVSQTAANLGGMAGGLYLGGKAPVAAKAAATKAAPTVQGISRAAAKRFVDSRLAPMPLKRKYYRLDNRASAIFQEKNPLRTEGSFKITGDFEPSIEHFRGYGVNPEDFEFAGNVRTAGTPGSIGYLTSSPKTTYESIPGSIVVNQYAGRLRRYTPSYVDDFTGEVRPVPKSVAYYPTDEVLRQQPETLFKGVQAKDRFRGGGYTDKKLASGKPLFTTPDPGLAAAYDPDIAVIDPRVAVKNPATGKVIVSEHTGSSVDPRVWQSKGFLSLNGADANMRVPLRENHHAGQRIFDPKATESLITPIAGDTSYVTDILTPVSNGVLGHFRRRGGGSRLNPVYMGRSETIVPAGKGQLAFPGIHGGMYPTSPEELSKLKRLHDWFGIGRVD